MTLELKKVKLHPRLSEETNCFEADVFWNGKKAGFASNTGKGAPNLYDWVSKEIGDEIMAWAEQQPTEFNFEKLDQIVDRIVCDEDMAQQLAKMCKKGLAYRLKSDKPGVWKILGEPFTPEGAQRLKDTHGDDLEYIAQERVAELRMPRAMATT